MKTIENLKTMIDNFYTERILWSKNNKEKTKLLKLREKILHSDEELLKELKDWKNYIDQGINILERGKNNERERI